MDNIDPRIWGKSGWVFMGSVALSYPNNPTQKDKEATKLFFVNMKNILPCTKCRKNYGNHLESHNIDKALDSKKTLMEWLLRMRNETNKQIKAPPITMDGLLKELEDQKKKPNKSKSITSKQLIILIIYLLVLFGFMYMYYRQSK